MTIIEEAKREMLKKDMMTLFDNDFEGKTHVLGMDRHRWEVLDLESVLPVLGTDFLEVCKKRYRELSEKDINTIVKRQNARLWHKKLDEERNEHNQ